MSRRVYYRWLKGEQLWGHRKNENEAGTNLQVVGAALRSGLLSISGIALLVYTVCGTYMTAILEI